MMRARLDAMRREGGFSLIEVSVTLILSSMVTASLVTVFLAFSQNSNDVVGRAEHQLAAREMIVDIVSELRQAVRVHPNGEALERLRGDSLEFYTMAHEATAPVRVRYERRSCVGGECELWVTRWDAVPGTGPMWQFADEPRAISFLIGGVLEDEPLFVGFDWVGDPKVKVAVTGCGGSLDPCGVPLVQITLRAMPMNTSDGARAPIQIIEQVRLRNA